MMEARLAKKENPHNEKHSFAAADAQYARFKQRLESLEVLGMEHSALEKEIEREGFELMRLLYQDHLLLRAMSETDVRERCPVVGSDGIERRHRRADTERGLMTPFGRLSVERAGYSAPGCSSLYPLDAELNLPSDSFSHGVRERVAREAAKNSFEETVETIQRTSGARLGKRQAEKLALEAARDFDEFYTTRSQYTPAEQEESGSLLILSVDGKGISMRPEGLREATRKKAEKRAKGHGPPSKSRKQARRNSKRMATVATVYGIQPYVRTPQEIMGNLQGVATGANERAKRPSPEHKRVWASLVESPAQVVGNAFDEALRRDPGRNKRWVALVDGNEPQLDALEHHAGKRGIALTIVLDLIHVIGYLWDAARVLGGDSQSEQHQWVRERLPGILQGKCVDIAAGMRRSATRRGLPQKQREPVDT
ncbi:MAG: ISKra4 family transposase, partial [Shimia sp.]|nr:ISKra4 family transposase [Shimia sp.]